MTTELSFTDVTLTFPDGKDRVTAVNNVSFTLKPGELISITGPSGSGKSSLLALAATLITPDSGSIMLGDTELARLSGKQAAECRRNRIGIVFQQSNLIPSLTALEQLEMMRHLGPPWRQKTQRKKVRAWSCWNGLISVTVRTAVWGHSPAGNANASTLPVP